jgi:hypothetical protein
MPDQPGRHGQSPYPDAGRTRPQPSLRVCVPGALDRAVRVRTGDAVEVRASESTVRGRGCCADRHCADRPVRRARANCDTGRLQSRRAVVADQAEERRRGAAAIASRPADDVQVLSALPRFGLPRDHPSDPGAPRLSRSSLRDARRLSALPPDVRIPARREATGCAVSMPALSVLSRLAGMCSLCGAEAVREQGARGDYAFGACLTTPRPVRAVATLLRTARGRSCSGNFASQ